jgi:hypothetical protein
MGLNESLDDIVDTLYYADNAPKFASLPSPCVLGGWSKKDINNTLAIVFSRNVLSNPEYTDYFAWRFIEVGDDAFEVTQQGIGQPIALTVKYQRCWLVNFWIGSHNSVFDLNNAKKQKLFSNSKDLNTALAGLLMHLKAFYTIEAGYRFEYATPKLLKYISNNREFLDFLERSAHGRTESL